MKKRKFIADINVTPFVDVMLVLLVIFLVTAPVIASQTATLPVTLPKSSSSAQISSKDPIIITVTASGQIYLQDKTISDVRSLAKNLSAMGAIPSDTIFIRGDQKAQLGAIVEIMNALNKANYQISLVTDKE